MPKTSSSNVDLQVRIGVLEKLVDQLQEKFLDLALEVKEAKKLSIQSLEVVKQATIDDWGDTPPEPEKKDVDGKPEEKKSSPEGLDDDLSHMLNN